MDPLITPRTNKSRPTMYKPTPSQPKISSISPPHVNQFMEIPNPSLSPNRITTHSPIIPKRREREVINLIDDDIDDNHNHNHNRRIFQGEIPKETDGEFDIAENSADDNDNIMRHRDDGTFDTVTDTNGASQIEVFFRLFVVQICFKLYMNVFI